MDAAADERWAAARARANTTPVVDHRVIRRRRHIARVLSAVIAAGFLGLLLRGILTGGAPVCGNGTDATVCLVMGFAVQGAGLAVLFVTFAAIARLNRTREQRNLSANPLNPVEQEWVVQQILTGTPVEDDTRRAVVLATCTSGRRIILSLTPILFSPALLVLGAGIRLEFFAFASFSAMVIAPTIVAIVYFHRQFRLRGDYLRRFGVSPAEGQQK